MPAYPTDALTAPDIAIKLHTTLSTVLRAIDFGGVKARWPDPSGDRFHRGAVNEIRAAIQTLRDKKFMD